MFKPFCLALSACVMAFGTATAARALDITVPPTEMSYSDGSYEGAATVKTDSQNNVYFGAISETGNGKIVKYNPVGQFQWAVPFDEGNIRPADKSPFVVSNGLSAIAVDASDNIYAVGESANADNLDCLLKKYDATGTLIWERRYNRLPSGITTFNQYCNDLTIDPAGNIIAAGTTQPIENGNIVNWSNRIIKWNADGTLLGTFGIETGNEACGTSYPCMIQIKRITADAQGNLFTIERSQAFRADRIVKYSPALEMMTATPMLLASTTVSTTGLASDERCGYLHNGLVKYDEQLAEICSGPEWYPVLVPGATGEYESVVATTADYPNLFGIRIDAAGNIYTVGYAGDYNKLIVFDSSFTKKCEDTRLYYDPAVPSLDHDVYDIYRDVVIGPNGNAFVVGSESRAFLIMEYDAQCQPLTVDAAGNPSAFRHQASTADRNYASSIAFDSAGSIIVAGQSVRRGNPDWWNFASDATALKFSRSVPPPDLFADLVVQTVAGPAAASSLETVNISGSIANFGTGSTGSYQVGVYLSADPVISTNDTPICTIQVETQGPATMQEFSCSGDLPGNLAEGTYYIGAIADSGNSVVELDEANNTAFAQLEFTALPDIIVPSVTVPSTVTAGSPLAVSGTVKNEGAGAVSGPLTVSVTLGGTAICSKTISSLLGGETAAFSCTGPTPFITGTYPVSVTATPASGTRELSSLNNTAIASVQLTGMPDLVVMSVNGPLTIKKGSRATYTGIIKNQGLEPASYFTLSGYTSPDGSITTTDALVCTVGVPSLAPGEMSSYTCAGSIPGANKGNVYFGIIIDSSNTVVESSESNNIGRITITVN